MAGRPSIVGAPAIRKHIAERRSIVAAAVIIACLLGVAAYLGIMGASASINSSPNAQYRTGQSLARQSQCSDAIQAYARALAKDPSFVKAYVSEAECYK